MPFGRRVAAALDGELAGLRGKVHAAGPVADHLCVVLTAQIPHRLEVLGVEALAVVDLGVPVRSQLAPRAREFGRLDLGECPPRREDAASRGVGRRPGSGAARSRRLLPVYPAFRVFSALDERVEPGLFPGPDSDARRTDAPRSSANPPSSPTAATPVALQVSCPSPWDFSVRVLLRRNQARSATFATGCLPCRRAVSRSSGWRLTGV